MKTIYLVLQLKTNYISYPKIPLPGSIKEEEVYGVELTATCKDMLGNRDKRYSDSKRIYLDDAEIGRIRM